MSHPTPPAFDSGKNQAQNGAEVQFWHDYIQGTVFQKAVLEFPPYVITADWNCRTEYEARQEQIFVKGNKF